MPITVTPLLTVISLCDALTGWTAVGGTNTLNDPAVFDQIQGNYCIQNYNAGAVNRGADYDFGVDTVFSDTVIYFWFAFSKKIYHATNPVRIRLTDDLGNWREWNMFTSGTLPHPAWIAWALQTTMPYDAQSATAPVMTKIRKVGWRVDAVIGKTYIYFDAWRYGTGLKITGGDSDIPATWENLFSEDDNSSNKYGVMSKSEGVYFLQGNIRIGDSAQTVNTYFKDTSKIVVFRDVRVSASFYNITVIGASVSYKTTCILGTSSGDPPSGISGCIITAANSAKPYTFTATDAYIDIFGLYGCTFLKAGTISLPPYSLSPVHSVLNSTFEACAEVSSSTCTMKNCNFINSPTNAVSFNIYITYCNFIGCSRGVHIATAGDKTFVGLIFSGCTYDVKSDYILTVTNTFSSNAGSYDPAGSTVTFVTIVTLTIGTESCPLITGSEIEIVLAGTQTEKAHEETSGTTYAYPYNWVANFYVDIFITRNDYEWYAIWNYLLPNANSSIPISQRKDRVYSNP